MFVADAHADTLYRMAFEGAAPGQCAVRAERLRAGGVGLQTFALFAGVEASQAYGRAVRRMLELVPSLGVPVHTGALPEAPPDEPTGVLSVEGGEILEGSLDRLAALHGRARVRMIALTWNRENEIGYPAVGGTDHKLKPFGRALILEMDRLGILVDVSHLNEAGFYDAAGRARLPIIASHSNIRTVCDAARNLTPDQVKAIIEKEGFIGINFYSPFLKSDGAPDMDDVIRHIDAIAELGGIDAIGFGSDFDGIDRWPEGLESPERFPALLNRLRQRGYTGRQLEGIAGLNLWRVLKRAEASVV